jgi:omega-6 fatty acid desaturase (delta-12 desaturase)
VASLDGADELGSAPPNDSCADGRAVPAPVPCAIDPRRLIGELTRFKEPRGGRALWELAATLIPFLCLVGLALAALNEGYLLALVLTLPAGLFLLRLFLIQHDCGHGAFFRGRRENDWLGRALGALTFTPYDCWRRSHALHHAGTGNLDKRGFGDVDTLTVREFQSRSFWGRFSYRFYRHPLVLLVIGPSYLFLLRHRLPVGLMKEGPIYWVSAIATNLATALLLTALVYGFEIGPTAGVLLPTVLIAASVGVWLFYIQHQFEDAHWDEGPSWSFHDAALRGSSHLDLPPVLRWFTANIGIHHVHHLASRIPFYRLPEVLRAYPELAGINRFTALQTLSRLHLGLWDQEQRRLVPFPSRAAGSARGRQADLSHQMSGAARKRTLAH